MSVIELLDHMPFFLGEIAAALRAETTADASVSAGGHGAQRLRLGFGIDAVVHEYALMHEAIVVEATEHGVQPTPHELTVLFTTLIDGISRAVSEYSRRRDVEVQRRTAEHYAFVAHELRSPLQAASVAIESVASRPGLDADERDLRVLRRSIERMQSLIDHELEVVRSASGVGLLRETTTLADLLEQAEEDGAALAEVKGITLSRSVERDGELSLDLRLVRSALANVVGNAIKYSCTGGTVELRGRVEGGAATIEVEDSCGGLPPDVAARAFAPFVRLDHAESGFGLGLAIAKQATDAHGGTIRVQDIPGKGCVSVLHLPAAGETT
jgi:signal transduction histidine kinase